MKRLYYSKEKKSNLNNPSEKNAKRTTFGRWFSLPALLLCATGVVMTGGPIKAQVKPKPAVSLKVYKRVKKEAHEVGNEIFEYIEKVEKIFKSRKSSGIRVGTYSHVISPAKEIFAKIDELRRLLKKVGLDKGLPPTPTRSISPWKLNQIKRKVVLVLSQVSAAVAARTATPTAKPAPAVTPARPAPAVTPRKVTPNVVKKLDDATTSLRKISKDRNLSRSLKRKASKLRSRMLRLYRKLKRKQKRRKEFTKSDQDSASKYLAQSQAIASQAKAVKETLERNKRNWSTNVASAKEKIKELDSKRKELGAVPVAVKTPQRKSLISKRRAMLKELKRTASRLKTDIRRRRYQAIAKRLGESKTQLAAADRLLTVLKEGGRMDDTQKLAEGSKADASKVPVKVVKKDPELEKLVRSVKTEIMNSNVQGYLRRSLLKMADLLWLLSSRPPDQSPARDGYAPKGARTLFAEQIRKVIRDRPRAAQHMEKALKIFAADQKYAAELLDVALTIAARAKAAVGTPTTGLPNVSRKADLARLITTKETTLDTYKRRFTAIPDIDAFLRKATKTYADYENFYRAFNNGTTKGFYFDGIGALYTALSKDSFMIHWFDVLSRVNKPKMKAALNDVIKDYLINPEYKMTRAPYLRSAVQRRLIWFDHYYRYIDALYTATFDVMDAMPVPASKKTLLENLGTVKAGMSYLYTNWEDYYASAVGGAGDPAIAGRISNYAKRLLTTVFRNYTFKVKEKVGKKTVERTVKPHDYFIGTGGNLRAEYSGTDEKKLGALYNGAMSILAIRQAELMLANASYFSTASSAQVKNAKALLNEAKRLFYLNFSVPTLDRMKYSRMVHSLAMHAIRMVAPPNWEIASAIGEVYADREARPIGGGALDEGKMRKLYQKYFAFLAAMKNSPAPAEQNVMLLDRRLGRYDVFNPANIFVMMSRYHPHYDGVEAGWESFWHKYGSAYQEVERQQRMRSNSNAAYLKKFQRAVTALPGMNTTARRKALNKVLVESILVPKLQLVKDRIRAAVCRGVGKAICRTTEWGTGAPLGKNSRQKQIFDLYIQPITSTRIHPGTGRRVVSLNARYLERVVRVYQLIKRRMLPIYRGNIDKNLMNGRNAPITPVQAIMLVEGMMLDLDPNHLRNIKLDEDAIKGRGGVSMGTGGVVMRKSNTVLTGIHVSESIDAAGNNISYTVTRLYHWDKRTRQTRVIVPRNRPSIQYAYFVFQKREKGWFLLNPLYLAGQSKLQYIAQLKNNKLYQLEIVPGTETTVRPSWRVLRKNGREVALPINVTMKGGMPYVVRDATLEKTMKDSLAHPERSLVIRWGPNLTNIPAAATETIPSVFAIDPAKGYVLSPVGTTGKPDFIRID